MAKKKHQKKKLVSVLIPYFREAEKLKKCVASLMETAGLDQHFEILVATDHDEPNKVAIQSVWSGIRSFTGPRPPTLGEKLNVLAREAKGDILWFIAQDYEMVTPDWPEKFRAAVATLPNGVGVLYPKDALHADHAAFPLITRTMMETVGNFMPPFFPYWFIDTWWDEIGILLGVKQEIGVEVKHQGDRGKSHSLVDLKFWAEVFDVTRHLRISDTVRLLRIAHNLPQDSSPPREAIEELNKRGVVCAQRVKHLSHPDFVKAWEANSAGNVNPAYPQVKAKAEEMIAKIRSLTKGPPKVAVCIPSTDTWKAKTATDVSALCAYSIAAGIQLFLCNLQGSMISNSRNGIVELALQEKCDYLLWIDSDMSFPPDALMRLLKHERDIVGATYNKKVPPFETLGKFAGTKPDGPITGGLYEALLLPGGMMLVKAEVYRKLGWPSYAECYRWPGADGLASLKELLRNYLRDIPPDDVLNSLDATPLGEWIKTRFTLGEAEEPWLYLSEDLFFCRKSRRAGYKIYCDLDLTDQVVHLGTSEITCKLPKPEPMAQAAD